LAPAKSKKKHHLTFKRGKKKAAEDGQYTPPSQASPKSSPKTRRKVAAGAVLPQVAALPQPAWKAADFLMTDEQRIRVMLLVKDGTLSVEAAMEKVFAVEKKLHMTEEDVCLFASWSLVDISDLHPLPPIMIGFYSPSILIPSFLA